MAWLFHETVERARQLRAAPRPHLDAGAWRGDPRHERARISRQHYPAHRRRQRHDAQFDEWRPPCSSARTPDEFAKLRAKPELVESMAPEIIRYQTPLAYMRRTALTDVTEFGGQLIH